MLSQDKLFQARQSLKIQLENALARYGILDIMKNTTPISYTDKNRFTIQKEYPNFLYLIFPDINKYGKNFDTLINTRDKIYKNIYNSVNNSEGISDELINNINSSATECHI